MPCEMVIRLAERLFWCCQYAIREKSKLVAQMSFKMSPPFSEHLTSNEDNYHISVAKLGLSIPGDWRAHPVLNPHYMLTHITSTFEP